MALKIKGQYSTTSKYIRDEYDLYCEDCEAVGTEPMTWADWFELTPHAQPTPNPVRYWY